MKTTQKQIETLLNMARERGWIPMFTHYHRLHKKGDQTFRVLGATTCVLLTEDGQIASRGAAVVSKTDTPSKVEGRWRSLQRAFRAAASSPKAYDQMLVDEVVWDDYLEKWVDLRMIPTKKVEGLDRYVTKFVKSPSVDELSAAEASRIATALARKIRKDAEETPGRARGMTISA